MKKYRSEKNSSIRLFGRNEHSYMCNTNEPRQIFVESTWFCHFSHLWVYSIYLALLALLKRCCNVSVLSVTYRIMKSALVGDIGKGFCGFG